MLLIAWSLILQPPCLMKVLGPSFFALSEATLPSAELSFLSFSVQEVVAVSTTACHAKCIKRPWTKVWAVPKCDGKSHDLKNCKAIPFYYLNVINYYCSSDLMRLQH